MGSSEYYFSYFCLSTRISPERLRDDLFDFREHLNEAPKRLVIGPQKLFAVLRF